ncbi:uncharacterized protein LOC130549359 [Triplophysa rosa]|uniref:uncharacterized protein LOC130549359 n=1 Tax=Triplophysa rosa TaxID=992332 RepID=UPI0025463668|nr:uncharacterized protein LOC130549359 [Triplophysa rosa]
MTDAIEQLNYEVREIKAVIRKGKDGHEYQQQPKPRQKVPQSIQTLEEVEEEVSKGELGGGLIQLPTTSPRITLTRSPPSTPQPIILPPTPGNYAPYPEAGNEREIPIKVQITGDMTVGEPIAKRTRSLVQHGQGEEDFFRYVPQHQLFMPQIQAPLVTRAGGNRLYQPWSHSDMTAIASKLPPITSGGSRWLSKLTALSHGTDLALGDLRCLLGQILTASQMQNLELDAQTTTRPNETQFVRVSTDIGSTLRRLYPVPPTVYQNIKFRIKPGETGAAYYFRCVAEWEQMVEENSLNNPVTRDIFRAAVMTGAPNGVKQAMENNPDIPVASNEVWERHLVHHTDRAVERANKEEEELERVKTQLLKLQLEKAKSEGTTKKGQANATTHSQCTPTHRPISRTPLQWFSFWRTDTPPSI